MTKLSGRSCRIYDDVRDSKILWDSLRKFDFGRQHSERVFPRTVDGSQQSYFDLPEFYGSSRMMDLWNWVYAIDDYFEEKNPPEQIQYQIAVYKLKGEARMWWENTLLEEADCDCDSGGKYQNPSWVMMRKLLICRYPHTTCLTKFRNQLNKEKGEEAPKHANCSTVCPIQSVNVKQEEIDVGGSSTGDESSKGRADSFMPSKCLTKCPNQVNEQKEAEMIKPVHVGEYIPAKCSTEVPYMPYIRKQEATDRDLRSLGESMEELEVVICGPDEGDYLVTEEIEEIEDADAMYEGLAFLFNFDYENAELHLEQKKTVEIGASLQPYVLTRFVDVLGNHNFKVPHEVWKNFKLENKGLLNRSLMLIQPFPDEDIELTPLILDEYMDSNYFVDEFASFLFDPGGNVGTNKGRHHTVLQAVFRVCYISFDPGGNHFYNGLISDSKTQDESGNSTESSRIEALGNTSHKPSVDGIMIEMLGGENGLCSEKGCDVRGPFDCEIVKLKWNHKLGSKSIRQLPVDDAMLFHMMNNLDLSSNEWNKGRLGSTKWLVSFNMLMKFFLEDLVNLKISTRGKSMAPFYLVIKYVSFLFDPGGNFNPVETRITNLWAQLLAELVSCKSVHAKPRNCDWGCDTMIRVENIKRNMPCLSESLVNLVKYVQSDYGSCDAMLVWVEVGNLDFGFYSDVETGPFLAPHEDVMVCRSWNDLIRTKCFKIVSMKEMIRTKGTDDGRINCIKELNTSPPKYIVGKESSDYEGFIDVSLYSICNWQLFLCVAVCSWIDQEISIALLEVLKTLAEMTIRQSIFMNQPSLIHSLFVSPTDRDNHSMITSIHDQMEPTLALLIILPTSCKCVIPRPFQNHRGIGLSPRHSMQCLQMFEHLGVLVPRAKKTIISQLIMSLDDSYLGHLLGRLWSVFKSSLLWKVSLTDVLHGKCMVFNFDPGGYWIIDELQGYLIFQLYLCLIRMKEMEYITLEMNLGRDHTTKNAEMFGTVWLMPRNAVIFLLFHGNWGCGFNLTRGRVILWVGWNDVDNTNTEGSKKTLKLFFKLVNGLDPPRDVKMSMQSLKWNLTVRSRTSFILFREMD